MMMSFICSCRNKIGPDLHIYLEGFSADWARSPSPRTKAPGTPDDVGDGLTRAVRLRSVSGYLILITTCPKPRFFGGLGLGLEPSEKSVRRARRRGRVRPGCRHRARFQDTGFSTKPAPKPGVSADPRTGDAFKKAPGAPGASGDCGDGLTRVV